MRGLYIHIPFCKKVCDYCDFSVLAAPERMYSEFIDLLLLEIQHQNWQYPNFLSSCETLYLGGGTPSVLSDSFLEKIFREIEKCGVNVKKLKEATMEFNPESCTKEKLLFAFEQGINRFSLGVQTFQKKLLDVVGRRHTREMALTALSLLQEFKSMGASYSADLMFSLPEQSPKDFYEDLRKLLEFSPDHVSFYGLQVSPHTVLESKIRRGILSVNEDFYASMYLEGVSILEAKGFKRYEVSNFALPLKESIHNQNYWQRGEYLGVGPGAHSYVKNTRFNAPASYSKWKKWVLNGCKDSEVEKDVLSRESEILETIWLSLRQAKGLSLDELQKKYDYCPKDSVINYWVQKKWLAKENTRIFLVNEGWIMMDKIVEELSP